ncbi:MAG: HEAT repeat domain-containing protein [Deltaproteobacteria bacterium]|nr:HEAT repeat domain-containing protein [Deltaproteobacteria bacterium]
MAQQGKKPDPTRVAQRPQPADKTKVAPRRAAGGDKTKVAPRRAAGGDKTKVAPKSAPGAGKTKVAPNQRRPAPKKKEKNIAEELEDKDLEKKIEGVQEIFKQFERSLKTIGLYRHNRAGYQDYLEPTYRAFTAFLGQHESLSLHTEQFGFKYEKTFVYKNEPSEQNVAHKFYRDGVRILVFRKGLTDEELLNFTLICLANFHTKDYIHDDMVSLLWKQEFINIEYVVVDSFAVGAEAEEDARIEVEKIVNYLYKRLTSNSGDAVAFARISLEDLDIELEDVEQAKGVTIKGSPSTPEQKARVQLEMSDENEHKMLPKLVSIIFRVLEEELDEDLGIAISEVFTQLLDSMLIHEDFRSINQILRKFKTTTRKKLPPGNLEIIEALEENFASRMGESERIEQVGQILDTMPEIKEPQEVYRYLTRLGENSLGIMLQVLEKMERVEARHLVCDAMVVLGKDHVDAFIRRLQSNRANLVRDMIYIIDKLNPDGKLKIIARLLDHPNLAIRLETLQTLGGSGDEVCRAYVIKALEDSDLQMRVNAARLLPNFDLRVALMTLMAMVQHQDFSKKHPQEQSALYAALASTNTKEAIAHFAEVLHSSSIVHKKKLIEVKRALINGLALSGSISAFKFLKAELDIGIKEEEVAQAAERACTSLRGKLLGA